MTRRFVQCVGWMAVMGVGAPAVRAMDDPPPRLDIDIKTVSEDAVRGKLVSFSTVEGLTVNVERGQRRRIPLTDLVRFTTSASLAAHSAGAVVITLVGGDRIPARITGSRDDAVEIESTDLGPLTIPLELVSRIRKTRPSSSMDPSVLAWFEKMKQEDEDLILLINGDVVRGFIDTLNVEGVVVESTLGQTTVLDRMIAAIRFTPAPERKIAHPYLVVTFIHGSRFTISAMNLTPPNGLVTLATGQEVQIEAERIVRVDVVGGRWSWLAAQTPISVQHVPMLTLGFDHKINRNVLGEPIAVAGETYEHGIGVHSRSSLTYDLQGRYRKFVSLFGLDDHSGPYADVAVTIRVDGQPRFEQAGVRPGRLFGPVRLDIAGAKRIELIVDFGLNGDLQDRFDWVEPALIR